MPKTVQQIYEGYKIMPNLQVHQLRVAAVAMMICDNFSEPLPKHEMVSGCLIHDMGNILKFKLDLFPEFTKPEGMNYWEGVKEEYRKKYGNDEHVATFAIAKELGVSEKTFTLIEAISFLGAPSLALGDSFAHKIMEYCDDRVNPFGVVSLEVRLADLRKRYAHKGGDTPERRAFDEALRKIEQQIFEKCSIKPEDITDEAVAQLIEELKNFVVK